MVFSKDGSQVIDRFNFLFNTIQQMENEFVKTTREIVEVQYLIVKQKIFLRTQRKGNDLKVRKEKEIKKGIEMKRTEDKIQTRQIH